VSAFGGIRVSLIHRLSFVSALTSTNILVFGFQRNGLSFPRSPASPITI